jgi:hypothetical protein
MCPPVEREPHTRHRHNHRLGATSTAPPSVRSPPTKNIPIIDLEKRVHRAIRTPPQPMEEQGPDSAWSIVDDSVHDRFAAELRRNLADGTRNHRHGARHVAVVLLEAVAPTPTQGTPESPSATCG